MDFISVKLISASDNTSASFDYGLGNAIVENPLVDAANGLDAHADHNHISVSVLKNNGKPPVSSNISPYPEDLDGSAGGVSAQHQKYPSRYTSAATPGLTTRVALEARGTPGFGPVRSSGRSRDTRVDRAGGGQASLSDPHRGCTTPKRSST